MKRIVIHIMVVVVVNLFAACGSVGEYKPNVTTAISPCGTDLFEADSASIAQNYSAPEWFSDAKFGIFIHWGLYSVPAYGSEWYSRNMYLEGSEVNRYHLKTYGSLVEFGYKDFIPLFKADKFDADQWLDIFKAAGARYVVPVAEHHDGFAMYDSSFNEWNAARMGPCRDVIGEIKAACQRAGLHFGLSSHRCENSWFYGHGMSTPSDVQDLSISLYGERLDQPSVSGLTPVCGKSEGSNPKSREEWLMHTYELVDKYEPDLMWFDWMVGKYPFQSTFYQFMAYYYNSAVDWGREVVVNTKFGYGDNIQIYDIERASSSQIRDYPWQTDTSIGTKSWSYATNGENKSSGQIVDDLVDIVSKNGNLLLNIGPTPSGAITPEQCQILLSVGDWLRVNGEAIYESRPWIVAGEGRMLNSSQLVSDQGEGDSHHVEIRFTTNEKSLYAIALEWSEEPILIESLAGCNSPIESVSMLGSTEVLNYRMTPEGLFVEPPKHKPTEYAHVFKILFSRSVPRDAF